MKRLVLLLGASGCFMAGNYHTAKTLDKGLSQFGMTFSATQYHFQTTDSSGNTSTTSVAIPELLPELTYHIGVSDNVEAGGRVALGAFGGEFDVKYRFFKNEKLHLAIAPAAGYQAFILVEGGTLRLPVIMTYELSDQLDFTVAGYGAVTHFKDVNSSADYAVFDGTLTSTGAAINLDLHGETMSIRPGIELTRFVWSSNNSSFDAFNVVNYMVHIAWTGGKEKKQLDRMEHKLDRMDEKLDRMQPGANTSPYPYAPGQYPPPPPGQYPPPPGQYPPPPGQYPPPPPPAPAPPPTQE
jgi:hypothetical protein